MIYLVTYDLSLRPAVRRFGPHLVTPPSPHPFFRELEQFRSWWHYLDKTWLISTEETFEQVDKRLRQHLGPTDKLLILKFRGDYAGALPSEAWAWIEERMSAGELVR